MTGHRQTPPGHATIHAERWEAEAQKHKNKKQEIEDYMHQHFGGTPEELGDLVRQEQTAARVMKRPVDVDLVNHLQASVRAMNDQQTERRQADDDANDARQQKQRWDEANRP
jgi:hypothetical protein